MSTYVIEHSGVKNMKWGVRRYQNKDGSLTAEGRQRYLKNPDAKRGVSKSAPKVKQTAVKQPTSDPDKGPQVKPIKPIYDMTDEELRSRVNRLQMEKQYRDLMPKPAKTKYELSKERKARVEKFLSEQGGKVVGAVVTPMVVYAGMQLIKKQLNMSDQQYKAVFGKDSAGSLLGNKKDKE